MKDKFLTITLSFIFGLGAGQFWAYMQHQKAEDDRYMRCVKIHTAMLRPVTLHRCQECHRQFDWQKEEEK